MNLALNNLQRLICHKTKQTKPNHRKNFKGISRLKSAKNKFAFSMKNPRHSTKRFLL